MSSFFLLLFFHSKTLFTYKYKLINTAKREVQEQQPIETRKSIPEGNQFGFVWNKTEDNRVQTRFSQENRAFCDSDWLMDEHSVFSSVFWFFPLASSFYTYMCTLSPNRLPTWKGFEYRCMKIRPSNVWYKHDEQSYPADERMESNFVDLRGILII